MHLRAQLPRRFWPRIERSEGPDLAIGLYGGPAGHHAQIVVALIAFAFAIPIALGPSMDSLGRFVYEDTFYYLGIAENVIAGRGLTFDGANPTNGFQPLWLVFSVAVCTVLKGEAALKALLVAGALLHGIQTALVFQLTRLRGSFWAAIGASAFFAINYRLASTNMSGLETGLAMATLLGAIVAIVRLEQLEVISFRDAALVGFLVGLAVASRFDAALPIAFGCAALAIRVLHKTDSRRSFFATVTILSFASLVLMPWLVVSRATSGKWLPNSFHAIRLHTAAAAGPYTGWWPWLNDRISSLAWWLPDLGNTLGLNVDVFPSSHPMAAIVVTIVATIVGLATWHLTADFWCRAIVVAASATLGFYGLWGSLELRYIVLVATVLIVASAWSLDRLVQICSRRSPQSLTMIQLVVAAVFLSLVARSSFSGGLAFSRGQAATRFHSIHPSILKAALLLKATAPPDASIGAFNAGILSAFSGRRTINLDGVVNDNALDALRQSDICGYIDRTNITYVVDTDQQIEFFTSKFCDKGGLSKWHKTFVEIAKYPHPLGGAVIVLRRQNPATS